MWANVLNAIYVSLVIFLSIFGLNALVITTLYLLHFRKKDVLPEPPKEWPIVAVQLPVYNEQLVAEHMIDLICAQDYPKDKLLIQVLDDSTDQTTEMLAQRVQHFRSLGYQIELLHRTDRTGYKASALAEGMARLEGKNVAYYAIFDADFLPQPDFLKKTIPYFSENPKLGLVQARWGHFNRTTNLLTRTQALFLDGHQVVEQVARSRSGLLLNFNGTCGVWRAECIIDSGGWAWDTFSEDIDLSYRAQINGWKIKFLPDLVVPGELPHTMQAFKKQQYRWTFGHIQVFRKLLIRMWKSPHLTPVQKVFSTFHLTTMFVQPVALATFLLSVPLALAHPKLPAVLGIISMTSSGPTILFAVSQIFGYREGFKRAVERVAVLPLLVLLAIGMTISNSAATAGVFAGRKIVWVRTPKYSVAGKKRNATAGQVNFTVPLIVWIEIGLSIYCAIGLSLALRHSPDLIPLATLGMLSYGYIGSSSLVESNQPPKKAESTKVEIAQQ